MTDFLQYRSRRLHPIAILFGAALGVILTIAGCEKSNFGTVSGKISIDGSPPKSGSIAFFPVDRKSSTAGAEILEGQYTAKVPLGAFKVEIRVSKVVGQKKLYNTPNSPVQPLLAEVLPAKYNDDTELEINVQPGPNQHDFTLTTH